MDRAKHWLVAAALSLAPALVYADTVFLAPPTQQKPQAGDSYPDSRFGKPPMRDDGTRSDYAVATGIDGAYTSRAVQEIDSSDGAGSRRPASDAPSKTMEQVSPDNPGVIARKGVQEVALIAGDLGFFPKTFFVTRDVPVRLFVTGASKNTLCIMMDSFQVRKQVRSQKIEEITFTPSLPGKYRFYCPVNGMEGTMVVRELVSSNEAN